TGWGDRPARSRSAVVSVRASFGLSRQSRARGVGAKDGWRSALSSAAAADADSYRLAALSHESRNFRKSARVSLSAASCARAAHSAALCRQYPIFSCIMVSAPPAALRLELPAELGDRTRRMLDYFKSRAGLKFRRVGGQSEACCVKSACLERRVGRARRCAFAHPTLLV